LDLQLIDRIPDLVTAGVNSFKIEGRMKRPEYVAAVTEIYARLLREQIAEEPMRTRP
jgi:putative protease